MSPRLAGENDISLGALLWVFSQWYKLRFLPFSSFLLSKNTWNVKFLKAVFSKLVLFSRKPKSSTFFRSHIHPVLFLSILKRFSQRGFCSFIILMISLLTVTFGLNTKHMQIKKRENNKTFIQYIKYIYTIFFVRKHTCVFGFTQVMCEKV